ncbi:MAG: RNA methyltransferase [Nitrospinae bacterium]|nr:RNA methyltransferase [Nitrospinota bacterium]
MGNVYLALIHYPVLNRQGDVVTSSVTGLDLHDLARVGRTYGVTGVFVVHPSAPQRAFVERVIGHFTEGPGRALHPQRGETLEFLEVLPSLDALIEEVERTESRRPRLAATTARRAPGAVGYEELRGELKETDAPLVILFGTSWGLADEVLEMSEMVLCPVEAKADTGFNHLSVRGAAAIIVDRILGQREV